MTWVVGFRAFSGEAEEEGVRLRWGKSRRCGSTDKVDTEGRTQLEGVREGIGRESGREEKGKMKVSDVRTCEKEKTKRTVGSSWSSC